MQCNIRSAVWESSSPATQCVVTIPVCICKSAYADRKVNTHGCQNEEVLAFGCVSAEKSDGGRVDHLGEGRKWPLHIGTAIAQGVDVSQGLKVCIAGLLI